MLEFKDVNHSYEQEKIINNFSLKIEPNKVTSLLGPSGCGKTTLLRLASGLEKLQDGIIKYDKINISRDNQFLKPQDREIGFVFQDCALFPHLNVEENIFYASKNKGNDVNNNINNLLKKNDFLKFKYRYPHELSGGQKQLVALFRAIASKPKLILMDEPFSNLDTRLREKLRDQILHILKDNKITTILVTHDSDEAMFMSDFIAVIRNGILEQYGSPFELYMRPKSIFVSEFFSEINIFEGKISNNKLKTVLGEFPLKAKALNKKYFLVVRSEGLKLISLSSAKLYRKKSELKLIKSPYNGNVVASKFLAGDTLVHVSIITKFKNYHLHVKIPGINYFENNHIMNIFTDINYSFIFES